MNCLEFRRTLHTEPGSQDAEFLRHKRECAACAPAVQRAARLERALRESLRVDVPEGLESRILHRHAFGTPSSRRRRLVSYALAATILVAAIAWGGLFFEAARLSSLEREVVSLVESADYALEPTDPVDEPRVAEALRVVGLRLEAPVGTITFASQCIVRGKLAGHLVLRERGWGPVTVFLIPASLVTERGEFHAGRWRGVLIPAPTGTIAVLGAHGDAVSLIETRVRGAVRWQLG